MTFRRIASILSAKVASHILSIHQRRRIHFSPEDLKQFEPSFSQFGEDIFLIRGLNIAERLTPGLYVDVGCFDPITYSNTRLLHSRGWHGVNIDASPAAIKAFERHRPCDHNVLTAISSSKDDYTYLEYEWPTCNRLAKQGEDTTNRFGQQPLRATPVRSATLDEILAGSPHSQSRVDYLNIDCEGLDFQVLCGAPTTLQRTDVITIETHSENQSSEVGALLAEAGFAFVTRIGLSSVFRRTSATDPGALSSTT